MIICPVLMVEQRKMMFLMKMKQRRGQRMKILRTDQLEILTLYFTQLILENSFFSFWGRQTPLGLFQDIFSEFTVVKLELL